MSTRTFIIDFMKRGFHSEYFCFIRRDGEKRMRKEAFNYIVFELSAVVESLKLAYTCKG